MIQHLIWLPGSQVETQSLSLINIYNIINAHSSDFEFQENNNIIPSPIPDFINLLSCPQEGAEPNQEGAKQTSILPQESVTPKLILSQEGSPLDNFQNQKLCNISPVLENSKNSNSAEFPEASTLDDIEDPYWYQIDDQEDDEEKIP